MQRPDFFLEEEPYNEDEVINLIDNPYRRKIRPPIEPIKENSYAYKGQRLSVCVRTFEKIKKLIFLYRLLNVKSFWIKKGNLYYIQSDRISYAQYEFVKSFITNNFIIKPERNK